MQRAEWRGNAGGAYRRRYALHATDRETHLTVPGLLRMSYRLRTAQSWQAVVSLGLIGTDLTRIRENPLKFTVGLTA